MKRMITLLSLLAPVILFSQEYSYRTLEFNLHDEPYVRSFTHKNLRIYPIKAKASLKEQTKNYSRYTPLKDALRQQKIRITEKGGNESAEVNTLHAQNLSRDTIFLMAGEVIQGGKQDRVIGEDVVIPPGNTRIKLPVYCVEHGRWSSRSGNAGQFNGYHSVSGLSVRKAVEVDKDQGKVWQNVAVVNNKNKVRTSTDAYTALSTSADYVKAENEYFRALQPKLAAEKDVVGVIIVSGSKVLGCEIFATGQLFRNASDNILKSYIHEAVTNGQPVAIPASEVKKYMDDLLINQVEQEKKINAKGKVFKSEGKKLHLTAY